MGRDLGWERMNKWVQVEAGWLGDGAKPVAQEHAAQAAAAGQGPAGWPVRPIVPIKACNT